MKEWIANVIRSNELAIIILYLHVTSASGIIIVLFKTLPKCRKVIKNKIKIKTPKNPPTC